MHLVPAEADHQVAHRLESRLPRRIGLQLRGARLGGLAVELEDTGVPWMQTAGPDQSSDAGPGEAKGDELVVREGSELALRQFARPFRGKLGTESVTSSP